MLRLIQFALRRPLAIIVFVIAVSLFSLLAIRKSSVDIFPTVNAPTIYVAQTYGGLSPQQMEGFITSYYEYHFLYITGIKAVESKSIQGLSLIKLQFHEGTNMANAMAEVVSYATRARSFMPPGTVPPFVMRYDAGSVPIGQLVFRSDTRSLNEIQDLALFKVRPMFAALSGVSAPPPFGGNQRTILIKADPERLRSYNLTADELVTAIAKNNSILPAGNIRVGDQNFITPSNSVVDNFKELENVAVKSANGATVFVRDVATVDNGADVTTGYALVNGNRSVYIPVTKRADASTWNVVQSIKRALPDMQAAIPGDIKVSYEFDQSGYVINSLRSLLIEGLLGALLTGLMVLLFLRDWRSATIVILTIPLALLASVMCLYLSGQTINIMTLGGLALAVGILVDEATVTIENIHRHLETGKAKARAVLDAVMEIATPTLLILLSILSVFVPAFFMTGVPRSMFMPLSLAVGFAMIASFLLARCFVPVLSNWVLKNKPVSENGRMQIWKQQLSRRIEKSGRYANFTMPLTIVIFLLLAWAGYKNTGAEIFPKVDARQMQVRLRMPVGTRIERTEDATKKLLGLIEDIVGKDHIAISSAFVGLQPPTYAINPIFLYTSGPHESVTKINLTKDAGISIETLREKLRASALHNIPGAVISFEPADLVEQVMSQGSSNPVEIVIQGKNISQSRELARNLLSLLSKISYLRDAQIAQPLDYPTIQINYNRILAGQMGFTVNEMGRSVTEGTSSSRFTEPVYWLDNVSGNAYQVQVEYPQFVMNSPDQVEAIEIGKAENNSPVYLRDVADWKKGNSIGEYDRVNQQRFITITANIHRRDLSGAIGDINKAIKSLGALAPGVKVYLRGQSDVLAETTSELSVGLLLAVLVIALMLAAYFQSFKISMIVVTAIPGVFAGSILLLWATGNTLNIESFMGCIMAIGVAVANMILLISSAENIRHNGMANTVVGAQAAANRLRPILMTSIAMTTGMLPMAIGLGESGKQTAPLGIAVIGGLLASIFISLLFVPLVYDLLIGNKKSSGVSLDPGDPNSFYYDKKI